MLSNAELIDSSFVEKLNSDSNSILPCWIEDSIKINNGMPITIADYNAYVRTYKMIPECGQSGISVCLMILIVNAFIPFGYTFAM